MKKHWLILFIYPLFFVQNSFSQSISDSSFTLLLFADTYYAFDTHKPGAHRGNFIYNHGDNQNIALNLALLQLGYQGENVRTTLGFMTGTYSRDNMAPEAPVFQKIHDASAGFRIKNSWWLDVGVFPSNIGNESTISKDNLTLTRSLMCDGSPYYLSGARLSGDLGEKWQAALYVVNGWQNIAETPANTNKALATQLTYQLNDKLSLTSSTFFSNEMPDSLSQMRYFHHFSLLWQPSTQFTVAGAFDFGMQKRWQTDGFDRWSASSLVAKYQPTQKIGFSARIEHFDDPSQIAMPAANNGNAFSAIASSIGFDFAPRPQALLRFEAKRYDADRALFEGNNGFLPNYYTFVTSLAVWFEKK